MGFDLKVHKAIRNGDGHVIGVQATPYIRISSNGEAVNIQSGEFYGDGGSPIADKNVPGWVWEQIAKLNPDVKRELRIEKLVRPE